MSIFQCPRNADVDLNDLQGQFTADVCVHICMAGRRCCMCYGACFQYIKFSKNDNNHWTLAKMDDEPRDPCVIGNCCFDAEKHIIKTDAREKRIERKKGEIAMLEGELKRKQMELSCM